MLKEGLKYTSTTVVGSGNTALALGSGDMDVFATPAMIALMENAAMNAVSNALPEGSATVGTAISTTHIKATPMCKEVKATATLTAIDGRKLSFRIEAHDQAGLIGEGTHERFIVDKAKFLSKLI